MVGRAVLEERRRRGYKYPQKCSRCSPRGRLSGSRGQNIWPNNPPPSRELHAQVLSENSRGADNPAMGPIIRPKNLPPYKSCRAWLDQVLSRPKYQNIRPKNPGPHWTFALLTFLLWCRCCHVLVK
jgi:hypothetical protein